MHCIVHGIEKEDLNYIATTIMKELSDYDTNKIYIPCVTICNFQCNSLLFSKVSK